MLEGKKIRFGSD